MTTHSTRLPIISIRWQTPPPPSCSDEALFMKKHDMVINSTNQTSSSTGLRLWDAFYMMIMSTTSTRTAFGVALVDSELVVV